MIESVTGCWILSQVNWRDVQQMFGCAVICLNLRDNDSWMLKLGHVSALILVLLCYQHGRVEIMWIMPRGGFAVQCISFHAMQPDLYEILKEPYDCDPDKILLFFFFLHCVKTSFSVSWHIDTKALQWHHWCVSDEGVRRVPVFWCWFKISLLIRLSLFGKMCDSWWLLSDKCSSQDF